MTTETSNARGEWVLVPREVFDFLMGEGELQGAWFGETPAGERGEWFWRKHLRQAEAAPPPAAARGDVPYDRELIARMLEAARRGSLHQFSVESVEGAIAALRAADNADAADAGTARVQARGDVRGLVAKWRAEAERARANAGRAYRRGDLNDQEVQLSAAQDAEAYADELEAALAADGVQAGEVEKREESTGQLLQRLGDDAAKWAAEFRATAVRLGYSDMDEGWLIGWFANAIENSSDVRHWRKQAALSQQPEARGVVDAALDLVRLVEGPGCVRWHHNGSRLKDTKEWCAFYVAAKNAGERNG